MMERPNKVDYYLDIADAVSRRGTCIRRRYGSVIVKNDQIVSTGYNGAPRGRQNCCDVGECWRAAHNIPHGTNYNLCRAVHSEENAIIAAGRENCIGATLYLCGREVDTGEIIVHADSCMMCKRAIINAGITRVIIRDNDEIDRRRVVDVKASWVDNEVD